MVEARGDALEWAIALAKAPGERMALRRRPVPAGMDLLMQIAAGSSAGALTNAAIRTGEPEEDLLEAARFYIREILFYQGADAYRMLGLAQDADPDAIRSHYRLLQQWLHPDRQTSDWDAIFASRVNIAWNQLRTPARRADYDAQMPEQESSPRRDASWLTPARLAATADAAMLDDADTWHRDRWRRRAPVLALGAVCVVLGIAAVQDMQRAPQGGLHELAHVKPTGTDAEAAVALQVPKRAVTAPLKPAIKPKPLAQRVASESKSVSKVMPPQKAVAVTKPAPPPVKTPVFKPAATPVVIAAVAAQPTKPPKPPSAVPVKRALTTPVTAVVATARALAKPAPVSKMPARAILPTAPATAKPIATAKVAAITTAKVVVPTPAVRAAVPEPTPVKSPAVAETVATRAAPTLATATPTASPTASPQQVGQAQQTGRQLLAFVTGGSSAVPPIWLSPAVQAQAMQTRKALQDGSEARAGEPHWRVSAATAAMSSAIKDGDSQQQLRVALKWRDQRWLVSSIALAPAP